MFANARTDIVVTYANQTDGVGHIVRKTVERDFIRQLAQLAELEGDGQIFIDKEIPKKCPKCGGDMKETGKALLID